MAGGGGSAEVFDIQKFKAGLVEEVRKRPALYDASNASYKDHKKLEDLWNDVVDVLDPDCKHDLSGECKKYCVCEGRLQPRSGLAASFQYSACIHRVSLQYFASILRSLILTPMLSNIGLTLSNVVHRRNGESL